MKKLEYGVLDKIRHKTVYIQPHKITAIWNLGSSGILLSVMDQLLSYSAADLYLSFRICKKKKVFVKTQLI